MSGHRVLLALAILGVAGASPANSQMTNNVGVLNCKMGPSLGLILGSRQKIACRFVPGGSGPVENYVGVIGSIGLDLGITAGGAMAWAVTTTGTTIGRGALAGKYVGASGAIGVGVGVGANLLVGGSNRSVSMQPLSVEGSVGVNLSLGVSGLTLALAQ